MSSDKGKEPILQGPSGRPDDAPRMRARPQGQDIKRYRDMRSHPPSHPSSSQPAEQRSIPSSSQPAEQQSNISAGTQTSPAASRSINNSTDESAKQVSQYTGIPVSESVKPTNTKDLPASARPTATMGVAASSKVTQDENPGSTDQDTLRDPSRTDENPASSSEDPAPSDGKPVLSAAARARKQKKRGGKKVRMAKAKKAAALAATMGSEDASESNTVVSGNPQLGSDAENAPNATMPCLAGSDVAGSGIKENTTGLSDLGREIVVGEILKSTLDLFDQISKGTLASNMTEAQRQEFKLFAGLVFDMAERDTFDATPNERHQQMITDFVYMMHDKISKENAASVPTEEVDEAKDEDAQSFLRVIGALKQDYTPRQLCGMLVKLQMKYDDLQTKNEELQKKNDEIVEGINKKTLEFAKVARYQRIKIDKLLKDLKNERRVKGALNKIADENTELTCRNAELESQMHVLKGALAGAPRDDMKNASEAVSDMLKNQVHPNSTGITKTMDEMENNLATLRSICDSVKVARTAPPADHSKLPPDGKLNGDGKFF